MPPLSIQVSRPFKTKLGSCFNLPHPPSQISAVGCWWCSSCKGGKSVSGMGGPREKRHQPEREMWTIRRYCTESRNLRPITIYTAALTYETGEERGGEPPPRSPWQPVYQSRFFCFLFPLLVQYSLYLHKHVLRNLWMSGRNGNWIFLSLSFFLCFCFFTRIAEEKK